MRVPRRTLAIARLFALGLLIACEDEGDPVTPSGDDPVPVSFSAEIQPIFDTICIGCHGADGNGGLDLRPGVSHGNLVDVNSPNYGAPRVSPGSPESSVLFDKVSGAGRYGPQMPLGGSLTPGQIETIRRWIAEGAADE